jgi:hypothetical protein
MQAADLLAIEEHVQDVCTALAGRMFDAQATHHSTGIQQFPKQVFLHATSRLFGCLPVTFSLILNFTHPLCCKLAFQLSTTAHILVLVSSS